MVTYQQLAGGYTGDLAGTIKSGGTVTVTPGGAGTSAIGQVTTTFANNRMINDFLDNLAAQQYLKMHNHKEETCDGCGCVCPCECPDCDVCSCGA